jgi:hypothetical protein
MPRRRRPENEAEIGSRRRLRRFLAKSRRFLEHTHGSLTSETSRVNRGVKEVLTHLWNDADEKLHGVIESQEIGNPGWRRDALTNAGVFGPELGAKERLFDYFVEEKRFLAVLKFLASIFGSLSKAFPILSAVKEFIDAVLCVRDWLPDDPEITSLGDLR